MGIRMKWSVVVAALLLSIVGCNNMNQVASVDVTGTWRFTTQSTVFTNLVITGTGTLQESGSTVSGNVSLSGTSCATTATLTGTISGTTFTFQLVEGTQTLNFTGTVSADATTASGTYTSPTGGCTNGDNGSWSAAKF